MSVCNLISCGDARFHLMQLDSPVESGLKKRQKHKIQDFINQKFPDLNGVTQIKIQPTSIKRLKGQTWEKLVLSESDQKQVRGIVHPNQTICLTYDLSQLVSKAIAEMKTPTFYFYSSGGGGHKAAKDARVESDWTELFEKVCVNFLSQYPESEDPHLKNPTTFIRFCKEVGLIQEYDVLHDFLGRIGEKCSSIWDQAQEAGDVTKQESLAAKQWISDIIFAVPIFLATLRRLIAHGPTTIVSTQAMATPSILIAIKVYNKFYKPEHAEDVKLDLYMTDMPTPLAGHFFDALKRIYTLAGKNKLTLHAPKPINETDWSILCGLDSPQVVELKTSELPVRAAFLQAAESFSPSDRPKVQIKLSCESESHLLQQVLARQNIHTRLPEFSKPHEANTFTYEMQPDDEGYFLMLGSRPTRQAIKEYVERFVEIANKNPSKKYHLFAFAGKFESDPAMVCFYRELCEFTKDIAGFPTNLAFLPLSFQDPSQLVGLMLQCHTITRSGGSTAMELLVIEAVRKQLSLPERQRLIHAQFVENRSNLAERIPVWEKGNYFFLQEALGAAFVQATDPFHLLKS